MASKDSSIQTVLVLNCSETKSTEELIKSFVGSTELLTSTIQTKDFIAICYPWQLDTKYYETEINFIDSKNLVKLIANDPRVTVEAIIAFSDDLSQQSFDVVKAKTEQLKCFLAEVQILCCQTFTDHDTRFESVQNWCIPNEYELIELEPVGEREADDFETNSSKRLMEALEAHSWPLMKTKSNGTTTDTSNVEDALGRLALSDQAKGQVGDDDEITELEAQEFEKLFSQFQNIKDKSSTLTEEERKKFAEEAAMAFWKALGGDDEDEE
jgi:hypothetical protein